MLADLACICGSLQDGQSSLGHRNPAGQDAWARSCPAKPQGLALHHQIAVVQARAPQLAQKEFPTLGGVAADKPPEAQPAALHAAQPNGPHSIHGHRVHDPVANWQPSRGDAQGGPGVRACPFVQAKSTGW